MRLAPFALAALLPTAALAFDPAAMTEAEREAFRAEVRAYLLDHPEVLTEAIAVLETRESQRQVDADLAAVAAHADAILADGRSWVGGNPDGDVTVVEFMDYRCGYCRRAFQEVEDLVADDGQIRFILKEFPILGPESETASRVAIATRLVHGPDAYKALHDALMTFDGTMDEPSLTRLLEALALDPAPVMARLADPEVDAEIGANYDLASALGISGTPTFVLGDRLVRGYVSLPEMQSMVEAHRGG